MSTRRKMLLLLVILMILPVGSTRAQGGGHPFVAADLNKHAIYKVDADGKIVWEYSAKGAHDIWLLSNGNILFNEGNAAREITPDKHIAWEYVFDAAANPDLAVHSCQRLSNGNTLIAYSGKQTVPGFIEVDSNGTVKLKVEAPAKFTSARLCRKTSEGTYLYAMGANSKTVLEYDAKGVVIRTIKLPFGAYLAVRLPNGNTLIPAHDGHQLLEIDKDDKVVWKIDKDDLPENQLLCVAGVQRLPNGNTVICNWGGHGHLKEQAQILEVTPDKKIVWQVFDWKQFSTPAHVQLLDVPGTAEKEGELLR
jgi:hypothetical protein